MISLCMDTSNKYLVLVLLNNDNIIDYIEEECFKKQSETITVRLDELCKKNNINPSEIGEICITDGPGSYTGIRIAMSIAKVIGALRNIKIYTISPFLLYSQDNENSLVLIDARSKRAYYALTNKGEILDEGVLPLDEILRLDYKFVHIFGDADLIDSTSEETNLAKGFVACKNKWKLVENIHALVPRYFKSNEDYISR